MVGNDNERVNELIERSRKVRALANDVNAWSRAVRENSVAIRDRESRFRDGASRTERHSPTDSTLR